MIVGYQGVTPVNLVVVHLLQRMVLRPHVESHGNGLLPRPVHTLHFLTRILYVVCSLTKGEKKKTAHSR
jgi:hypothetical protein